MSDVSRRAVLGSSLALAACGQSAQGQPIPADLPPLKSVAPFRIGASVQALHLDDPALVALLRRQVSQLTAEWQMKMEYIVQPDGSFRFDAPDRIVGFAQANGMAMLGHVLVWYAQAPEAFERLDENRIGFEQAYRNYILAVAGRYRGKVVGWDVVNEAVAEDGDGWRTSLWSKRLGDFEHIALAFRTAREADPGATLLLNDYNLEYMPKKRATFLKLAERLLASGAPLTGIGTQMHVAADIRPGEITTMMRDLANLGLPIHVSELDVSLTRSQNKLLPRSELEYRQARTYGEAAEAFVALPARQRFAFTAWSLRDKDSWLTAENAADAPTPFDNAGRPKAAAAALVEAFKRG